MTDPYAELKRYREADRATRMRVRCANCSKLLAELVTAPWLIRCTRCKEINRSAEEISEWSAVTAGDTNRRTAVTADHELD